MEIVLQILIASLAAIGLGLILADMLKIPKYPVSKAITSLVALNQNMKTMADQIIDYAAQNGTTDIDDYIGSLKEKNGIDFSYSFSGTDYHSGEKVQLGDVIECRLTCRTSVLGFGEFVFPVTVQASASGISQVYWK